jgi:glycine cleavage system H protein
VYVELPEVGRTIEAMGIFGVVESVKAVSDLYSPVSGTVVEVNTRLEERPELVNHSPYGEGWMMVLEVSAPDELHQLLDATAYRDYIAQGKS